MAFVPTLTPELARQFALILQSGMPSMEAARYFVTPEVALEAPEEVRLLHDKWIVSPLLQRAINAIQGKAWQEMSLEEKINLSIAKHYAEMAYFLYAHNYGDLEGAAKLKADTCRDALEKKLAGSAGQRDALSQFLADVKNGSIKLMGPAKGPTQAAVTVAH